MYYICVVMLKRVYYIFLSILLTFAVTDYIWLELFQEDQVAAEIQSEVDFESSEEELSEDAEHGLKPFDPGSQQAVLKSATTSSLLACAFLKRGNSYELGNSEGDIKLFLKYCQLRIHS